MQTLHNDLACQLPCGIFSFKENGTITYINNFLLQRLNYSEEEIVGQPLEKILTLASRIFYQTHFFPLLKLKGNVEEIFLNLKGNQSTDIPFLVNARLTVTDDVATTICVCMPINERRKYEDEILQAKRTAEDALNKNEELLKIKNELEKEREELDKRITQLNQKNKELLQLNDVVTHDLQEPVRKIGIFSDIIFLNEQIQTDETTSNALKVVQKSSLRIQALLIRLQDYMVISTDNLKKLPVDLTIVVKEEASKLQKEKSHIPVTFEMEDLPTVQGNELQLHILFRQLLSNCYQFRDKSHTLHIKITSSLIQNNQYNSILGKYKFIDFVKVTVSDNGIGFDETYSSHIFKILKKMDKVSEGLGFGLAYCSRIVENHGGSIKAKSRPGEGASFIITLPLQ